MKTTRRRAVIGVVVVLAAVGIISATRLGDTGTGAGRRAPSFRIARVDGDGELALRSFRGTPVVVNFWATWCVPCRKEMADFQAVHEAVGTKVQILGINNRDSRRVARRFLEETGVTYPSGFDPGGQLAATYEVVGMPTTVFIDAQGDIVSKHTGALDEASLRRRIQELFDVA